MTRLISIIVGLVFVLALLWSLILGIAGVTRDGLPHTVESAFHQHPKAVHFASDGAFGRFDNQQLQRGFKVYTDVCAACHSLSRVAFRDLAEIGYNEDEVKAIAAGHEIPVYDRSTGEVNTHAGTPTDYFPPVAYAGNGTPPDLSLEAKANHGGGAYIYSLLTGYQNQPAKLTSEFPDAKTPDGLFYNPYFANLNIAMPPPLTSDGQVTYSDGTNASVDQMSRDVAAFLIWTAEPKLDKRKQTGWTVIIFLIFATAVGYMAYRNVWHDTKH